MEKNSVFMINFCLNNMQFLWEQYWLCMHEIIKLYAIAFHFTCMGTSCISGVSARHDFEQMKYIGGLSTVLMEFVQMKYIGGLSTILSESVQLKYIEGLSTVLSESVQMRKKKSEGGPTFYRSLSIEPSRELKQIPFVLEIFFFIHGKNACVRESVRTRGMGLGMWHSCRKLHNFYLNGYEFCEHDIASALRWGVALV